MPTLRETSTRTTVPGTMGTLNRALALGDAAQILADIAPAATTGNSVHDFLEDILARLSHPTDSSEFQGQYDNSATYAVGDEVYWIDGSSRKVFFKRLTAGDDGGAGNPLTHTDAWSELTNDIHEIPVEGDDAATREALLTRHPDTRRIRFSTQVPELIAAIQAAYQSAAQVQAAIDITAGRLADTVRWRGAYGADISYRTNDYVLFGGSYYRRLTDGTDSTGDPTSNTDAWAAVTGVERLIVLRLRDIETLVTSAVEVSTAPNNRGRWLARERAAEGYGFELPPMQWRGAWAAGAMHYYGDVVSHLRDLWVLDSPDSVTTGKTGAGSAPGTDADWTLIPTGQSTEQFRGEWDSLSGQTLLAGDTVRHGGAYYLVRVEHQRTNAGPETDETRFLLLDDWQGAYVANRAWHAGTQVSHAGEVWQADAAVTASDPVPGADGNHKWRQISGATQADLDELREEIHNVVHGAVTSRGTLVSGLELPITDETVSPVWLPRRALSEYTAPAALLPGDSDVQFSIGQEPGEYEITRGTPNRITATLERATHDSQVWYGVLTRAGEGGPWTVNAGEMHHNPVGSAVMGLGIRQLSATSGWLHLVVKRALWNLWGGGEIYVKLWNHAGARQAAFSVAPNDGWADITHGGVGYVNLVSAVSDESGPIQTIAQAADEAERTVTFALSRSANGTDLFLGDNARSWTLQPADASQDEVPVYSGDVHNIRVLTRTEYEALAALAPRTLYLVHGDSS